MSVQDSLSGLENVGYRVDRNGEIQKEELLSGDKDKGKNSFKRKFKVSADNLQADIEVEVFAEDMAGNVITKKNNFRINTFIPNISVDFGDENPGMDDNGTFVRVDEETDTGYFKPNEDNSAVRTATVEIECDRGSFYINNIDNNAASQILNSISYTSEQNEERTGAQVASISDWSESEGSNSNTKKYTATVTFTQNGKYEWNPVFTDDSGNTSEEIDFCDSITPKSFVIDNIAPTGSIQGVNKDETVWDELWNSIKDFFTFGQNNTNSDASFVIKGYDTLSPVESIHYYKCLLEGDPEEFEGLTIEELNNLDASEWVLYTSGMKLSGNESFVLYAKIVDYAHNVRYISTDGIMVDGSAPSIELEYPSGVAGYYSDEIKVTAHVHDTGDTATGLDRIFGTVIRYDEQGNPIEEYITKFDDYHISEQGVVYDFDTVIDIPVTGRDGNDVRITVNAVDNVGNTFSTTEYMKFDSTAPDLKVEQPEPELKLYNHDVTLTVEAFDATSSLDKITYTITKSNGEKAEKNCEGKFVHEQNTYKGEIVVPADVNGDVIVDFTARDIAGNITTRQVNFRVNTNQPKITVDFGGDNSVRKIDDRGYFSAARTAKVVVTCDSVFFDPKEATESILSQVVSAVNLNGEEIDLSDISMSDWNTISGATPFNNMHEATVVFAKEGNYTWMPCYTDRAGNVNTTIDYKKSVTPNHFTVDYTKPTGAVTIDGIGTWNDLVSEIDLSRSSKTPKQVTGTAVDTTSPIASVMYYRTSDPVAKTEDELNKITDWKEFSSFISYDNEQMIVYLRMEDYAGNVTYMGTNGVIFDNTDPIITLSLPQGSNVIYAGDVNVGVAVEDPVVNGAFSGIKSITYEILSEGTQTENGTLYTDNNDKADADDLAQKRNYSLKVSAEKNNSNQVAVRVTATDHAGNSYMKIINFMIDITLPEISVAYDNNAGDTSFGDVAYFNKQRVATIRIQERNFSQDQVSLKVTNEDGAVPQISAWSVQPGSGNGDGDVHTATLVFSSDGRYTFDIGFTDQAGNISPKASYGNSLAPTGFVVDTTKPVVEVSYDNNSVKNDNYYNDTRVATVTVREHNFETGRIALNISAKDNDTTINAPTISTWTSNGDVHMATLAFDKDAYYTWNLEYTDKAGNVAEQMASQKFYVDTAAPELTVSGIQNHSANNDEGNIGFALECKDSNFDVFEPALFTVRRDGNSFVEEEIAGVTTSIANGKRFKVENLPNDGIYTLHCVAIDKAGNEYEYVNRMDENGKMAAVPCTSQQDLVNFSVNREGSVFWLNDLTTKVVNSYYVQSVNQDVCVLEANPDPLESYEVELNGLKLQEGVDYTVSLDKEDDSWYLYTYSISHSLFKEEGENSISVQSIDKTQTTAYSDVKNLDISFVVDQTAPVVTLSGLESGGRYQADEQNVTAIVTDDGGRLRSVQVFLLDADGLPMKDSAKNDISRRFDLSGEELDEYLAENNGQVSFTVPEGIYMTVRIICNDYSVDNDGNTNECFEEYKNVTVSPNAFVIFIANRVLQYTLGGVIGGALILIFLILLKKKKDAEKS